MVVVAAVVGVGVGVGGEGVEFFSWSGLQINIREAHKVNIN